MATFNPQYKAQIYPTGWIRFCAHAVLVIGTMIVTHSIAAQAIIPDSNELQFGEPTIPGASTLGGELEEIQGIPIFGEGVTGQTNEQQNQIGPSPSGASIGIPREIFRGQPRSTFGRGGFSNNNGLEIAPIQQDPAAGFPQSSPFLPRSIDVLKGLNDALPSSPQRTGGNEDDDGVRIDSQGNRIEVIRQLHPNGRPQILRHVTQDKEGNYYNHGLWTLLDANGQLLAEGLFHKGRLQGKWKRKHFANSGGLFEARPFNLFEGPFISEADFNDGELHGDWSIKDRLNRPIFSIPYTEGKRDGKARWWYPNGIEMREVTFVDGILDGQLKEWDERKNLRRQDRYVQGKKVVRETSFYRPKQLQTENFYLDAKLELEGKDNWWEAKPSGYVPTGERVRHGQSLALHPNGQPKMKGQYRNDVRVGRFLWWHNNGQKHLDGHYKNGQQDGTWTWWHSNGMKAISGGYKDNQPDGVWTWWNTNGEVTEKQNLTELREREERRKVELENMSIEDGPNVDDPESESDSDAGTNSDSTDPFQTPSSVVDSEDVKPETANDKEPATPSLLPGEIPGTDTAEQSNPEENKPTTPENPNPQTNQGGTLPPPKANDEMEEVEGVEVVEPSEYSEPVIGGSKSPKPDSAPGDSGTPPSNDEDISDEDPFDPVNDQPPAEFKEPTNPITDPFDDGASSDDDSDPLPGVVPMDAFNDGSDEAVVAEEGEVEFAEEDEGQST